VAARQASLFTSDELPENLLPWEIEGAASRAVADVVFNRPLPQVFQYLIPEPLVDLLQPGQRVRAPFGRGDRPLAGYCVGVSIGQSPERRLKSLVEVIDREPLVDGALLNLTRWIADHTLCGWGQVLESVVPAGVKNRSGTRELVYLSLSNDARSRWQEMKLPAKQKAVVAALAGATGPLRIDDLAELAGCGVSPIQTLRDKGIVVSARLREMQTTTSLPAADPRRDLKLNVLQLRASESILAAIRAAEHRTFLLHGVTGSGKTEVYMRAIEEVVAYRRQAIVLVPEISLTPQTIRRFRSRFERISVLHSHLSDAERHAHWRQIATGDVDVVIGARSAVFAPTPHLGLIVLDEEHESSFKQETTPRYHAREVARERARSLKVPLVLGTATPTLESWQRAIEGKDVLLSMPERVARRPMPPVVVVDIRNDPYIRQGGAIGRALLQAMQQALKDDGQIILFLNVRGFSPVLWCRACGEPMRCPNCDISLTWHKQRGVALCHGCDYETKSFQQCPKCQAPGLRHLGTGTERLEAEIRARFPDVPCLRMDSDTMSARGSHDAALESFRHGQVKILLGTQMIAKGLDFPQVTLVGVVDADTVLHQPDPRASERTFQLIAQVAGRTGRGDRAGRVLVQTCCPDQPAIQAAARHDFIGFAREELIHRQEVLAPPFSHSARLVARGPREAEVQAWIQGAANVLRELAAPVGARVRGPAPCQIARAKTLFRYHLQVQHESLERLLALWRSAEGRFPPGGEVDSIVDVDPLNLR
jgi:primosomal protein N' (replication factor Y)